MWQQEKEHLRSGVKNLNLSIFPISPFDRLVVGQGVTGQFNTGQFALQEPCPVHTRSFERTARSLDSSIKYP